MTTSWLSGMFCLAPKRVKSHARKEHGKVSCQCKGPWEKSRLVFPRCFERCVNSFPNLQSVRSLLGCAWEQDSSVVGFCLKKKKKKRQEFAAGVTAGFPANTFQIEVYFLRLGGLASHWLVIIAFTQFLFGVLCQQWIIELFSVATPL